MVESYPNIPQGDQPVRITQQIRRSPQHLLKLHSLDITIKLVSSLGLKAPLDDFNKQVQTQTKNNNKTKKILMF